MKNDNRQTKVSINAFAQPIFSSFPIPYEYLIISRFNNPANQGWL